MWAREVGRLKAQREVARLKEIRESAFEKWMKAAIRNKFTPSHTAEVEYLHKVHQQARDAHHSAYCALHS